MRLLPIGHTAGSNIVSSDGGFRKSLEGQYLYLNGWRKIREVTNENRAILSQTIESDGTTGVPIVTMNEIELSGDTASLSSFAVDYVPRVR